VTKVPSIRVALVERGTSDGTAVLWHDKGLPGVPRAEEAVVRNYMQSSWASEQGAGRRDAAPADRSGPGASPRHWPRSHERQYAPACPTAR